MEGAYNLLAMGHSLEILPVKGVPVVMSGVSSHGPTSFPPFLPPSLFFFPLPSPRLKASFASFLPILHSHLLDSFHRPTTRQTAQGRGVYPGASNFAYSLCGRLGVRQRLSR